MWSIEVQTMARLDDVKSALRLKRAEYQNLRSEYAVMFQNIKANVDAKKAMREEIAAMVKEKKELEGDA